MLKWIMPKFLSDLTPQDWFKLAGLAVAGTLLYADVHSSIEQQIEHNARQDKKLVEIQDTLRDNRGKVFTIFVREALSRHLAEDVMVNLCLFAGRFQALSNVCKGIFVCRPPPIS